MSKTNFGQARAQPGPAFAMPLIPTNDGWPLAKLFYSDTQNYLGQTGDMIDWGKFAVVVYSEYITGNFELG